jgi:hypothetical protein
MINDVIRHITVEFLKTKDQAAQKVKDYLTYLKTHKKPPYVLLPKQVAKLLGCGCSLEWFCDPYNMCFIYELCFCEGSGAFPPIKPVCFY